MKWKDLDMKLKIIISLIVIITSCGSAWAGFYATFAKQKEFEQFVMGYQFDKERERKEELLGIIYDCETKYKDASSEIIIKTCKDAKIEYDILKGED